MDRVISISRLLFFISLFLLVFTLIVFHVSPAPERRHGTRVDCPSGFRGETYVDMGSGTIRGRCVSGNTDL